MSSNPPIEMPGSSEFDMDVADLESVVAIMRTALLQIVQHQEAVGGDLAVFSTTRRIAQNALEIVVVAAVPP